MLTFYEFFAGGGMARIGLGPGWRCLFANDVDVKKAAAYRANFGSQEFKLADVADLRPADLPDFADLIWASFPCQDLSLAGQGRGLSGERSGTFWPFWKLVERLVKAGRGPRVIALENVCGMLTSHGGEDFAAVGSALAAAGYRFGAIVVDARYFLPQSRPRLFIVGVQNAVEIPPDMILDSPNPTIHPKALVTAFHKLPSVAAAGWIWWQLRLPEERDCNFADFIEDSPSDVAWASLDDTRRLLSMMSPINLAKVQAAQLARRKMVGGIYRRTRHDSGSKVQRAEIRFDEVAGCLRTPAGGSSRQRILVVQGNKIRARLLSAREAARLMGLPERYKLPERYNDAYHLIGDGVAVPVVRHLSDQLIRPILSTPTRQKKAA